ncbi:MAG: hypothetical protein BGP24_07775 [Lysobacterales bacterium 69-70]|nr:amino acid adenylation domain-containing protein [Xanthomonadaceae bacterium]ODV15285.1 MAG: hypothetical protein ABT27_23430 [Xanthomonadaceae bacterium SCN 69-25]OJZ02540.1 MAG: hypothetical protein BGP24_07775 [Xanthomonadales bacterium 69-70]
MSLVELIRDLAARDIRLWVEAGELKFSAPAGAFDADTRAQVIARKPALIAWLSEDDQTGRDTLPAAPAQAHPPLSAAEERLWFLYRYEGPSPVYNVLTTVHTPEAVDLAVHAAALDALVARHESLRTCFDEADGVPFRVVREPLRIAVPLVDLSALPAAAADVQVAALIAAEEQHLFELTAAPLLRSSVLRLGAARHLVMINIHHAATDAWSMGVLMREYAALTAAAAQGKLAELPAPARRYADFAAWQQHQLRSGGFAAQLRFWQDYLRDLPPLLQLPADYPRPAVKRYEGRSERRLLPLALAERLGELCRGCGATLFMGLLAAFKLLLARLAQVDDVAVGTAVAGRRHAETADVVGMFTNTIVVRSRVDETRSFRDLIEQVRDATVQAQANQDIPFRAVVEQLVGERSLAYTPLYQVSLALNNAAEREVMELAGHAQQFSDNDGIVSTAVKDDLSVQFRRFADALELKLTYDIHLYSAATAARLTDRFADLLARLVEAPAQPLAEIALLGAAERERLCRLGINAGAEWPADSGLCALFAAQAAATPHAIAVQDAAAQYSYALLDRVSDALAAQLRARGARPLDRIGLCVSHASDMAAGMLAILKLGAAYVPLDLGYPRAALDHIVADTGLRLVLGAVAGAPWSADLAVEVVTLDLRAAAAGATAAAPAPYFGAAHPAYVIYTSGSTGKPKGVEVSQRNIVRLVRGADYVPFGADSVFVQMSNHAFDAATFEVWGALLNGGRLVHVSRETVLEPLEFGDFLAEHAVSAMFITVALFNLMADVNPRGLATVSHVLVGGEALNPQAVRRIYEQGKPTRLINAYGPTENTTFSTWREFVTVQDCARCAIGGPIAHSSAHVVDARGELVPAGVVGELLVGGAGVALGYANRPDLTAERFVPDPFGDEPGARLYRSGDWVTRDADGVIDYVGRFDNQVKIRGFRIETDEIQSQLAAHPAVREAVIAVQTDAKGDKRLAAYLVTAQGEADLPAIRDYLRQQLPDYKQPSAYACLERLPLTPNGKIDRARLPHLAAQESAAAAVAPRDALERTVAAHWRELLGVGDVAIDDDFFDLGGHSLLAITLSVRLRDELGVDLCTRDIFEHPTLAALAARLRSGQLAAAPQLPPIERATRQEKSTLSFLQQRLWFIEQMEGAQAAYHMPLLLEFAPEYTPAAIAAALNAVVARHEALRTGLVEVNGIPLQRIRAECPIALPLEDLGGLDGAALAERRDTLIGETLTRPFDLGEAPLLRAQLIGLPGAAHLLVIAVHHVVCDGWSLGNLTRELALLLAGNADALPALSVQYGDYAHWQKRWLDGDILARQLDFWRERLAGAPAVLDLRCARPRPAQRSGDGRTATARLDAALAARLKELAQREGASLFMAMLTGFKLLLARHAGHDDIVVGTPIANRPRSELEPLIGFFANTLALRTRVDERLSFVELLARVRDNCLAAYAYQDTPLDLLVDALNPPRSLAHAPLVQVVFGQENFGALLSQLPPGLRPLSLRGENRTAKFDLNLSFEDDGDGLQLYCEYSSDLFDADTIAELLQQYPRLLARLAAAPVTPLARLSALDAAAEAQARERLNAAGVPALRDDDSVAARFARIAQAQPAAAALLGDDGDWTYAQLAQAAQRVAAALQAAGLQPQQPVGLALPPGRWRIAAALGVLACGAVVVPLAPEQGSAALAAIAARAGVRHLLADAGAATIAGLATIVVDDALPASAPLAPVPLLGPQALACLLYADADAAGVALPQASLLRLADGGWLGGSATLRGVAAAPVNADAHLLEIWTPLLNGAALAVSATACAEVDEFAAVLARRQVQWLYLDSAQLEAWAAGLSVALPQLSLLVYGGEDLSASARAQLARRLPQARLRRVHGPTENGVVSLAVDLDAAAPADALGRSVIGSQVRLLDLDGLAVPCGVIGQPHYGGGGLAQGYWQDPVLTALHFVPDAESACPGARCFRAAERAVLAADGSLAGRGADTVGPGAGRFAPEPAALEALLKNHPDIHDAAVLVHAPPGAAAGLVGFVVLRDGAVEPAALQQQLQRSLPPSQRPAALIALDVLPQTAAGAPDRQLLQRRLRGSARDVDTTAPVGATEQAIAAIWAELLGCRTPGRHANFFDLGGHSLLAAQVCGRINQQFGIGLRVKSFYASADLAALATLVDEAVALDAALAEVDLDNLSDEQAERLLAQLQSET